MEYIKSFSEEDLCNLIMETKESLFICMPLLHPKVINTINTLQKKLDRKDSIHFGLDFSPQTFRQGYGEIESYEGFSKSDYKILNLIDNRISFIISDTKGYFLFFESRYFIPAEKATLNAVLIDPVSIVKLKHHFFEAFSKKELSDCLANAIIEESVNLKDLEIDIQIPIKINSSLIDSKLIDYVKKDLYTNPPLQPDYKRKLDFYINKFQYAQLEFNGANLKTKKIGLPPKALPIKNADLKKRLETKLALFDKESSEACFKPLEDFKIKIVDVRSKYLVPLKLRKENILRKGDKTKFEAEVNLLKKDLADVKKKSLTLVSEQIEKTKKSLLKDLVDFFVKNPDIIFSDKNLFFNKDTDPKYFSQEAENLANEIIYKIKWPKSHDLMSEFDLVNHFSDITIEDLKNEKLIKEFLERKLIDDSDISNLADFGKAIEVGSNSKESLK